MSADTEHTKSVGTGSFGFHSAPLQVQSPPPMTPDQWQRIQELFEAAAKLSSGERKAFLKRECADDSELQREVERLLLNHENPTDFLTRPLIPSASLSEGDVIANRYWIISLIGRGGMGEVYEAEDQVLRESVAIKKLRPELSNNETVVRQFQKEIQLARRITHPNICRVFDVGADEPTSRRSRILFFSMELLDGETLATRIHREGRLSRETAFAIAIQIADGLAAAHSAGVVHTDFKSGNIILVSTPEGVERAVITDFGLARRDPTMLAPDTTRTMVQEGQIAGTVAYMSPEQLQGGTITPASDIYSFGIVLFEMATGLLPFDDRRVIHSAMQRADPQTVSVRAIVPDIDDRWDQAIMRCLRKTPEDRFQSAAELADWLRGAPWWEPRLWTRRDWIKAGSAAAVSLASGGGLWVWSHRPYQPNASALVWYDRGQKAMHSMTYEAARKTLEKSIAADPNFALAHAALARTYDELDYSDRAKELMLRAVTVAQETRLSRADELRLRALQFMVSRDYERAVPLFDQLEGEARDADKAAAALESGWLAQQREDTLAAE